MAVGSEARRVEHSAHARVRDVHGASPIRLSWTSDVFPQKKRAIPTPRVGILTAHLRFMRRFPRGKRAAALAMILASTVVAVAHAASPDRAPRASREQVVQALRALASVTQGVARKTTPGAAGTLEDAIARFAPAFPNVVQEGEAPAPKPAARCNADMALVAGRVCVDRYEASLLEVGDDGIMHPYSPYHPPVSGRVYVARSAADVVPQAYITGREAQSACKAAGKRLCEASEWRAACGGAQGYAYPYGPTRRPGVCNDRGAPAVAQLYSSAKARNGWGHAELNDPRINAQPNTLAKSGERYGCVNDYGIWDMVGNLHEWTADPNGTFQGGYYLDTSQHGDGCAYRTTAHEFDYRDYSIGFRCCADPT